MERPNGAHFAASLGGKLWDDARNNVSTRTCIRYSTCTTPLSCGLRSFELSFARPCGRCLPVGDTDAGRLLWRPRCGPPFALQLSQPVSRALLQRLRYSKGSPANYLLTARQSLNRVCTRIDAIVPRLEVAASVLVDRAKPTSKSSPVESPALDAVACSPAQLRTQCRKLNPG